MLARGSARAVQKGDENFAGVKAAFIVLRGAVVRFLSTLE
jgi:hypothetical protein